MSRTAGEGEAVPVQFRGVERFKRQLAAKAAKIAKEASVKVVVDYSAPYAIFVHENLEAHHPVGQAKFLEAAQRKLLNDGTLAHILTQAIKNGKTVSEALLLVGFRIQEESQKLVPVDTGRLRDSASTRLEPK